MDETPVATLIKFLPLQLTLIDGFGNYSIYAIVSTCLNSNSLQRTALQSYIQTSTPFPRFLHILEGIMLRLPRVYHLSAIDFKK